LNSLVLLSILAFWDLVYIFVHVSLFSNLFASSNKAQKGTDDNESNDHILQHCSQIIHPHSCEAFSMSTYRNCHRRRNGLKVYRTKWTSAAGAYRGMGTGRAQCQSQNFSVVIFGAYIRAFYAFLND